jgi:outer membrane murein-binding lipoprotein Lpp
MKKLLLPAVVSLSLIGCTSTGGLSNLPVEIQTLSSQTQAIAQAICKFVPTVATIGAVAASLFPGGGAIDTVANGVAAAICSAVAGTPVPATPVPVTISASARKGGALKARINGIPIEGQFKTKYINGTAINGSFVK